CAHRAAAPPAHPAPAPRRAGAASATAHSAASTDHAATGRRAAPTMSDATTPADYDGICNNGCTTRCYARRMSGQVSEQGVRDEAARSGFRVEDEEPWWRGGLGLPLSDRGSGLPAAAARRVQNRTSRTRGA